MVEAQFLFRHLKHTGYLALGDFRKLGVEFFKASGNLSDFKITDCSRGLPLWWQFHFTLEIFFLLRLLSLLATGVAPVARLFIV